MSAEGISLSLEHVPCPLCGAEERGVLFSGRDLLHGAEGRFGVSRCGACGFVFTSPRPREEDMPHFYPEGYSPHTPKPPKDRPIKDALRRRVLGAYYGYPSGGGAVAKVLLLPALAAFRGRSKNLFYVPWCGEGRILDVGCGAGKFLWRLRREGWTVKGLDMSEAAARSAAEAFGVDVAVGTYPHEHFAPGSFDVVTLWNSLEHMSDPLGVLESGWRVLADGGRLYVSVPNFDSFGSGYFRKNWFPLDLPRHLSHFTPATIRTAFERAGLEPLWVKPLRRTSALKRSAAYTIADGDRRLLTRMLKTRPGAGLVARILRLAGKSDIMVVSGRKEQT